MKVSIRLFVLLALFGLLACGDDGATPTDAGPPDAGALDAAVDAETDAGIEPMSEDCDPLVPSVCGYPFPNSLFLRVDESTTTGVRVDIPQDVIPRAGSRQSPPDEFNRLDGFSPGGAILAHFPEMSVTGLATPANIARSLADDHPTVLIDAASGERLAHWAELDTAAVPGEQSLLIRPVAPLPNGHRIVVAIRGLVDEGGEPIAPSPAFAALRDDTEFDHPSITARREGFESLFTELATAGVARDDLLLAWDFTVGSSEGLTAWMLHMRDEALATVGAEGPSYVIDEVEEDPEENVRRFIHGRMTVPMYLDREDNRGRLVFGEDGLPEQQGTTEVEFVMAIPPSATETPGRIVQYGHGQLYSREQLVIDDEFHLAMEEEGFVGIAVDLKGMAIEDNETIISAFQRGTFADFVTVPDRLHQGMLNQLLATRMAIGGLSDDPMVIFGEQSAIDTSEAYYYGSSQGGIFGATYMALATDVHRGVLGAPGQSYNLLLQRSRNYQTFEVFLQMNFDGFEIQMVLGLLQMLWDRMAPTGYSRHIREGHTLPNTPGHEVMMIAALGDHQVTTLGAHVMARAIGLPLVRDTVREVYGLEVVDSPHEGSGIIEFDFGLPPEPIVNVPHLDGRDPHDSMKGLGVFPGLLRRFLYDGMVDNICEGPCTPE